jgi:OHCU decarboxylase
MAIEPNEMTHEEFMATFGPVFEHSPWIAEAVWEDGLDVRHDTAAGMHEAMCNEIRRAGHEQKLDLIKAHPDLGVRVRREELTRHSRREQNGAGLDQCTDEEFAEFQRLNQAYREKFGFPFILAVKGFHRKQILEMFRRRLQHSPDEEFQTALAQAMRIALFRLQDIYS